MDPDATLANIASLLGGTADMTKDWYDRSTCGVDLDWACQDLFDWIDKGGFEPNWREHELAASYYRSRAVSHRRGERVGA